MSARHGVAVLVALIVGVAALAVYLVRVALGLVGSMDGAGFLAVLAFAFAVGGLSDGSGS